MVQTTLKTKSHLMTSSTVAPMGIVTTHLMTSNGTQILEPGAMMEKACRILGRSTPGCAAKGKLMMEMKRPKTDSTPSCFVKPCH